MSLLEPFSQSSRSTRPDSPLALLYAILAALAIGLGGAVGLGTTLGAVAAGALLVGMVSVVVLARYRHHLLLAFFFILPFYPLTIFVVERAFGLGGTTSPLRMLRDLMAIALLGLVYSYHLIYRRRLPFKPMVVDGLVLLLLLVGAAYVVLARSLPLGLLGFRENYIYFLFYFIGRATCFQHREWRLFVWVLVLSGVAEACFALYQAWVLGPAWLAQYRDVGTLFIFWGSSWTQRGVGTFSSPNELGGYLTIILIVLLAHLTYDRVRLAPRFWPLWGAAGVLLGGILITYSRTSWIALALAVAALLWHRKQLLLLLGIVGVVGVVIAKPDILLYLQRTISFADSSAAYHRETFFNSLPYVIDHFYGVGLGSTGTVQERFAGGEGVHFEGFYFNLVVEAGIWSLALLLGIFALLWRALHQALRAAQTPFAWQLLAAARALTVAMAATGFFLPLMVSREVAFLFWFFVGAVLWLPHSADPAPTSS